MKKSILQFSQSVIILSTYEKKKLKGGDNGPIDPPTDENGIVIIDVDTL